MQIENAGATSKISLQSKGLNMDKEVNYKFEITMIL